MSLIYSLNVADWLCTSLLLRTGSFFEANPLMSPVMGDMTAGLLVKCILPAVLLAAVYLMCLALGEEDYPRVDRFISFVLVLYTAICLVHIADFLILIFA